MRQPVALARLTGRPKVPLRSWVIVTLALAAFAITIAWLTSGGQAEAAPVAYQAPAAGAAQLDRAAVAVPAFAAEPVNKTSLARAAHEAAVRQAAAILAAHTYTVRSGDSLSTVAARRCGTARDWTGIYAASRAHGWTGKNANVLNRGQHLYLSCTFLASQLRYAPAPPPPPVHAVAAVATARTGGGSVRTYRQAVSQVSSGSYHGASGTFQACVIARESGGRADAVNPSSGAGGLYQFLPSTWHALGYSGLAQNASVAEQNAAFQQAYSQSGVSPWRPYDGC